MAQFIPAFQKVIKAEGGYQANPNDKGNYDSKGNLIGTKYGISAPVLERYLGRAITTMDMKNLDLPTVQAIYRKNYWAPIKGDLFKSQSVANFVFDWGVNSGVGTAAKYLQRTLRDKFKKGIQADGAIGPKTISAANSVSRVQLLSELIKARELFFKAIVARDPSQSVFLKGWLNRLTEFEKKHLA